MPHPKREGTLPPTQRGEPTVTTDILRAIATQLRDVGEAARLESPGCVVVKHRSQNAEWWFSANFGRWRGNLRDADGEPLLSIDIRVDAGCTTIDRIVSAIRAVLERDGSHVERLVD